MNEPHSGFVEKADPTPLTTQALLREVASLKELIDTRLTAMDRAIKLAQDAADRQPSAAAVAQQVEALDRLIQVQTRERDAQRETSAKDVKSAVEQAFAASKEYTTKIEAGFTKQIDAISLVNGANTTAMNDKIADIKERLTMIESYGKGASGLVGYVFGAAGFIVAVVTVAAFFLKHA